MKFVNLCIQSEYSLLRSLISLDRLFLAAKSEGYDSLALCDNDLYGAIKFYQGCKKNNIKPIIGLRVEEELLGLKTVILLYAKSNLGYQNLMKLASKKAINNHLDFEDLRKYSFDVLAILGGSESDFFNYFIQHKYDMCQEVWRTYQETFKSLYLGIDMQTRKSQQYIDSLVSFAKVNAISCVAIHQTNFLNKDDFYAYEVLRCIDLGINVYPHIEREENLYFPTSMDIENLFHNHLDLVDNTQKIADLLKVEISFGEYKLPKYGDSSSKDYLVELCQVGLKKRLQGRNVIYEKYRQRLEYELKIINQMGFSDYFLIVYDYVKYAKQQKILVGPGRGSAPGSLVSYCLGITDIDPLRFDLLFERFLNPERVSMPDIDVDFPDDRRDEVINYLGRRFGVNRVSNIVTFDTFGPRMALRDVARVMRIAGTKLNYIMRFIPTDPSASLEEVYTRTRELQELSASDATIAKLFAVAMKLTGLPRHTSTHAAGVVMADTDLIEYTPLTKGINDLYQTQYEASDLEALGLVKMDILGLKNLSTIDKVIKLVEKEQGIHIDLQKISLDDPLVFKMIRAGDTDGIFQLESSGMRKTLMRIGTSSFMDIVHANALYRPGPMEMIPEYIKNKKEKHIHYLHPDLQEILSPTYGIIVFQEQIMLIAQKFAGYSLGMADVLRRAVSKKNATILENERKRFVESSIKKGYSFELSNQVYDYIVRFANYGFNKNHSVAYSLIAYQMSFLKCHYYIYFMTVLMSNSLGNVDLIQNYIKDCQKKKVIVNTPNINYSTDVFVIYNKQIYYPLIGINGIGSVIVGKLLEERTKGLFKNYSDFVLRTKGFLNTKLVTNLIYSGALDIFKMFRKTMVDTYEEVKMKAEFASIIGDRFITKKDSDDEYGFDEISRYEKEALGFNLKYNVFLKYEDIRKRYGLVTLDHLENNNYYKFLFILKRVKEIHTKKNELMAFVDLYDDTQTLEGVIFPLVYQKLKVKLEPGKAYVGDGRAALRDGKIQVVFENVYNVN